MKTPHAHKAISSRGFSKRQSPASARIEFEKSIAAREIGISSGLFIVPEILEYDDKRGEIVFNYLRDLVPLQVVLSLPDQSQSIAASAGRALAIIHRKLKLAEPFSTPLPPIVGSGPNEAWLHGDFNLHNLCVQRSTGALVIVDWSMTQLWGGRATFGTRYFDVAWFLYNLFCQGGLRWPRVLFAEQCAMAFWHAYAENCKSESFGEIDAGVTKYIENVIRCFQQKRATELGKLLLLIEKPAFISMNRWVSKNIRKVN